MNESNKSKNGKNNELIWPFKSIRFCKRYKSINFTKYSLYDKEKILKSLYPIEYFVLCSSKKKEF